MTPRYLLMLAVVLGPFGCDPDPARGPKPEAGAVSLAGAVQAAPADGAACGGSVPACRGAGPQQHQPRGA